MEIILTLEEILPLYSSGNLRGVLPSIFPDDIDGYNRTRHPSQRRKDRIIIEAICAVEKVTLILPDRRAVVLKSPEGILLQEVRRELELGKRKLDI